MPIYEYQCVECETIDKRVAGLDDHQALCIQCGNLMLRTDSDLFAAYFPDPDCPWCGQTQPGSSKICPRHAAELQAEIEGMG